mgnify:FL=1
MSVYVKESAKDMAEGLSNMETAMIEDYNRFMYKDSESHATMRSEYASGFAVTFGSKYIKICERRGSVLAFIVNTDKDKKFKMGDILKPAGYNAPARNAARGNILEGGYPVNWTGPLYLK